VDVRIRWLARALHNLRDASEYIAEENPAAARQLVARIEDSVALLENQPALGRPGRVPGTRELIIPNTPFIVPYRLCEGRIDILRVFHASRRWPAHF